MSHQDRTTHNILPFDQSSTKSLRGLTTPSTGHLSHATVIAPGLVDMLNRMLRDLSPDRTDRELLASDSALATKIADRPRWSDRSRPRKQSAFEFFHAHYPDCAELRLTWVALTRHDPQLCKALRVHQYRNPSDHIPLLDKTQATIVRYQIKCTSGAAVSIEEVERVVRLLARKRKRKLSIL